MAQWLIPMIKLSKQTIEIPLLLFMVVDVPVALSYIFLVVAQRQIHMVQTARRTLEILQFFDKVFDDPLVLVVRVHRCRRGEDTRAPTVALVEKLVMLRPLRVWALVGAAHHPGDELMGRFF